MVDISVMAIRNEKEGKRMSVSINTGQSTFEINNSRVERMMSSDKSEATHMGLWDKFMDLFRSESKAEALETLYNLLHPAEEQNGSVSTFEKLKSLAGPAYQDQFKLQYNEAKSSVDFMINDEVIHTEDASKVKNEIKQQVSSIEINGHNLLSELHKVAESYLENGEQLSADALVNCLRKAFQEHPEAKSKLLLMGMDDPELVYQIYGAMDLDACNMINISAALKL